jgi:FkbM family methyltransferase
MDGTEIWLTQPVMEAIDRLRSKALAVDVGANVGGWTKPLAELFDSVLAFEPDERNFSKLQAGDNVTAIKAAIADETGEIPFYIRSSSGHNSILEVHPIGGEGMRPVPVIEEVQIPCLTLDDACEDGADFVKMDIEGGEVVALRGCVDAGRWARTTFVVECHDTFAEVAVELERLGKRVTRIPHPLLAHPGHCWAIGE